MRSILIDRRSGQSLIESCVAIALISLIFMGMLQLSLFIAAREVSDYAAARGARAKTVGFNKWMVKKTIKVGNIPNSGKLLWPDFENEVPFLRNLIPSSPPGEIWDRALQATPHSTQYDLERARIPFYLGSESPAYARITLDYKDWPSIRHHIVPRGPANNQILHVRSEQDFRLWVPMHRSFYDDDKVDLKGNAYIENHYDLYIDDLDL